MYKIPSKTFYLQYSFVFPMIRIYSHRHRYRGGFRGIFSGGGHSAKLEFHKYFLWGSVN